MAPLSNTRNFDSRDITGVYSRSALSIMLQQEIETANQSNQPFALLLLDLDHFKSVNDAFGHQMGDKLLAEFAARLQKISRADDPVFRYGGDEFVILLKGVTKQQAVKVANRLMEQISEKPYDTTPPLTLTISLGVVSFPSEGQSAEELFEIADRRHYMAKRSGRGQVVSENPELKADGLQEELEAPSRLIDRDQQFETYNHFLAGLPDAQRGVFTVYGPPGSGKSRFLSEARKVARLQGYAVLSIRGTQAVKTRVYGALDIARQQLENLPPPSNGILAFNDALKQLLTDKGNAGLLVTVSHLARIDRFTIEYIRGLLESTIRPIGIVYASEDLSRNTDTLREALIHNAGLNESVALSPISMNGLRTWIRHSLHWEAPRAFIEWFQRETGGSPAKIKLGLQYVNDHSIITQTSNGREYKFNFENLYLDAYFNSKDEAHPVFNFPSGNTAFIGREDELRSIKQLLRDHRLITLLGTGGSGKSRLALQAATELWEAFHDGIFFVPLSSLSGPDFLITTLANFLQLPLVGTQNPKEQLINLLQNKSILLVLDNFENLISGSELLSDILAQTNNIRILVTSRERLDLPEERLIELKGLNYPEPDHFENAARYNAAQLFALSAQRSRSDFQLTEDNIRDVAQICYMVGGMPLGIELAAAWVQTFEPAQISEKIKESLAFLATQPSNMPEAHRSIQAVLNSFWDSLSTTEQDIVCRLSVFKTRFSEDAARVVAGASPFFLEALVARSLLRKTPRGQMEMHGLLRQFAHNQLEHDPQVLTDTHKRHCTYYLQYLYKRTSSMQQSRHSLEEIDRELDNIRAAWYWGVENQQFDTLQQAARALDSYYTLKGYLVEGSSTFQAAADAVRLVRNVAPSERIDSLFVEFQIFTANFLNWLSQYDKTRQIIEEVYPLADKAQNYKQLAEILLVWGIRLYLTADYTAGLLKMEKALELVRQTDARQLESDILRNIGNVLIDIEDVNNTRAGEYYRQSLEICRQISDRRGESSSLNNLGLVSLFNDRYREAIQFFDQNLMVARQLGDRTMESISLSNLGTAKTFLHEFQEGKQHLADAMDIMRYFGSKQDEGIAYWSLGFLQMSCGQFNESEQSLQTALHLLKDVEDRGSVSRILGDIAILYLLEKRYKTCQQHCLLAQEQAEEVGLRDVKMTTSVTLGWAAYHQNDLSQAEAAFKLAIDTYNEVGQDFMAVEPYAGMARVALSRQNIPEALRWVENILSQLDEAQKGDDFDQVISGLMNCMDVYLTCFDVLETANDPRAAGVLNQAYQLLMEFASRAGDEILRQSYLNAIPSHERILKLVEKDKGNIIAL